MSVFYVLKKSTNEDEENPLKVKQKQMNLPILQVYNNHAEEK